MRLHQVIRGLFLLIKTKAAKLLANEQSGLFLVP